MKERTTVIVGIVVSVMLIGFGISYAFFTANRNNISASEISTTTGKMVIEYTDGTGNILTNTGFQPSNKFIVDKTFTLTGTNTAKTADSDKGLDMYYEVGLEYTSTFKNNELHYYIKRTSEENSFISEEYTGTYTESIVDEKGEVYSGYYGGVILNTDSYLKLVSGNFKPDNNKQVITFNLKLQFPDTGDKQDYNKNAYLNGKVVVNHKKNEEVLATGNSVDVITSKLESGDTDLYRDYTDDKNIRYTGANPNNYVKLDGDDTLWQIVGIFDTKDVDSNGNLLGTSSKKLKLVRSEEIGEMAWNTNRKNNWSTASLQTYLNNDYLNSNSLSDKTKEMIANVEWNTGGIYSSIVNQETLEIPTKAFYENERGNAVYTGDGIERQTTWNGKVALVYYSDYVYASKNEECRNNIHAGINVSEIQEGNYVEAYKDMKCKYDNWLNKVPEGYTTEVTEENLDTLEGIYIYWTLSPDAADPFFSFAAYSFGLGHIFHVWQQFGVLPALYLKSEIQITGGNGSIGNPYQIGK